MTRRLFANGVVALMLVGLMATPVPAVVSPAATPRSPRPVLGTAVADRALTGDAAYPNGLTRYAMLTPENASKWSTIHPERNRYDFTAFDRVVDFARAHGQQVQGIPLVWYQQVPQWLTEGNFTRSELIAILYEHILTVVGRYRGRVANWVVVNEDVQEDGTFRTGGYGGGTSFDGGFWRRGIGDDYVDLAFRIAHAADPAAKLFYNDYAAEVAGVKYDGVNRLVGGLVARGVPIDGVGLQMHTTTLVKPKGMVAPAGALIFRPRRPELRATMRAYASLGLDVAITEMDVRLQLPATAAALQDQAGVYSDVLRVCRSEPNCTSLTTWGYTDKYSWVPAWWSGTGAALPFDESFRPKPAAAALGLS